MMTNTQIRSACIYLYISYLTGEYNMFILFLFVFSVYESLARSVLLS